MQFRVHAALGATDQATTPPLFGGHAGRRSVGLEVCRVDHHGRLLTVFRRQSGHHPREDPLIAPPFPTVVKRLVWAIGNGCVTPA